VCKGIYVIFFWFLGNYQIERGVVMSFTSYIILFKLLNWRRVGAPKQLCSVYGLNMWSNGSFQGKNEILLVVPTWLGDTCFFSAFGSRSMVVAFSFLFSLILGKHVVHKKIQYNSLISFVFRFDPGSFDSYLFYLK